MLEGLIKVAQGYKTRSSAVPWKAVNREAGRSYGLNRKDALFNQTAVAVGYSGNEQLPTTWNGYGMPGIARTRGILIKERR